MKVRVYVKLKPEVLDPQGDAVRQALHSLGFQKLKDVRVGKCIELTLDNGSVTREEIQRDVRAMCDQLLANPVIEDYEIEIAG